MSSRRTFIRNGLAVSAMACVPVSAFATTVRPTGRQSRSFVVPSLVIYDRSLEEADRFAAAAASRGSYVEAIGSDPGRVWLHRIEPLLRREANVIAGLTAAAPHFCLELLARDYGLRTICRVAHLRLADGRIGHRSAGSEATKDRLIDALNLHPDWMSALGSFVAGPVAVDEPPRPLELIDLAEESRRPDSLFTWILAPR